MKNNKHTNYLINLIFPAVVFGSLTGVLTAVVITLYKVCAKYAIAFSEKGYHYLQTHLYFIPIVLAVFLVVSFLLAYIYKAHSNLRGGGIPTSIGVLRGVVSFRWWRSLIGVFFLSLMTFLLGVPLGNEGPAVQMGTSIGSGSVRLLAKKHRAWDRYSMTGGACAGFSVATGAPISGIMFAVEEAHQRISPMIIIVSCISVMFSRLTVEIISPIFGVSTTLFPNMKLMTLGVKDIWIPLVIGIVMGLFAVVFLKYYKLIHALFNKKLKKIPSVYKIFFVLVVTLALGLCSFSFISTGHELIIDLFDGKIAVYTLVLLLLARATLTLCANSNRITGGIFLPILALGALLASIMGKVAQSVLGLDNSYYLIILVLGITACISGMMKMPLTAIVFAIEALSCHENILCVVTVSVAAYMMTEIFDVKSINEKVLERRVEAINESKERTVIDTFVTVQKGSFAIGKQVRDIFWPANLFVLSVHHADENGSEVDEHGGNSIRYGDVLHVRYSTFDEEHTRKELVAIVGEQNYKEKEADII